MNAVNRRDPEVPISGSKWQWYWMPAAVLFIGIISLFLLVLVDRINERLGLDAVREDAIMDMQSHVATYHLWLEEALTGHVPVTVEDAFKSLDQAIKLIDVTLEGGESENKWISEPLANQEMRARAEELRSLLIRLKEKGLERLQQSDKSGSGSALEREFHALFMESLMKANAMEEAIERDEVRNHEYFRRLFFVVLGVWIFIVVAATAGLWNREAGRRRAEYELRIAKDELEIRVAQRTSELRVVNEQLGLELSERRQAEEALREREKQFRGLSDQFHTLLDSIADPLFLVSRELKVIWANRSAGLLLGQGIPSLEGQYCHSICSSASIPCEACPASHTFLTAQEQTSTIESDSGRLWEVRTFPVHDETGGVGNVLVIAGDITEKTVLQKEAARAAHLASLGELAAGVAHEINNPVSGIISCAEILLNKSVEGTRENDLGRRMLKEGNRIAYIVQSLLSFSREETGEKVPVHISDILADVLALTETQMEKEGIALEMDVPAGLPPVSAHPQQLEQVFLNVINNSRDALNQKYPEKHEGKLLRITAKSMISDDRPYLRITFYDQGTGIPAHSMNRIFNPFFTTKPRGKGTGLGLSISHEIILNHGGKLKINSMEGDFTEVVVDLPLPDEG